MRRLLLLVLLGLALYLSYALYRTWEWAGDAHGLVTLAGSDDSGFTRNPLDTGRTLSLLTPGNAVWLLENTELFYGRCTGFRREMAVCDMPMILWAGRGLGGSVAGDERLHELIGHFIARGEAVDAYFEGMTALHEAILFNDRVYLERVLDGGADAALPIRRPDSAADGLDAAGFLELLEQRQPCERAYMYPILGIEAPEDRCAAVRAID